MSNPSRNVQCDASTSSSPIKSYPPAASPGMSPRSTASSSATAIPLFPSPPRSFSDPFASQPALQPSPDIAVKYATVAGSRRASVPTTIPASLSGSTRGDMGVFGDPLPGQSVDVKGRGRKVPYGPGFYIPPPGYVASSMGIGRQMGGCYDLRAFAVAGGSESKVEMEMNGGGGSKGACCPGGSTCCAIAPIGAPTTNPLPVQGGESQQQALSRSDKPSRSTLKIADRSSFSSRGALTIWAVLAILLAGTQAMLLGRYEREQRTACTALTFAALFLALYAVLMSIMGLLVSNSIGNEKSNRNKRFAMTFAVGVSKTCGFVVCLGAILQLSALAVYAFQSMDKSVFYSVVLTILIASLITIVSVALHLHRDGHLCPTRRRHHTSKRTKQNPLLPVLPISDQRPPPSTRSSISSHSGKYVPDYGLDSDSDSDQDDPRVQHPHADWTDEVLDGLIRSSLLDMPKRHHQRAFYGYSSA